MALLEEIVYNIKNKAGGGEHSKDLVLGNRQIEFNLNTLRATSAVYNLSGRLSIEGFLQALPVVPLTPTKDYISQLATVYKAEGLPVVVTATGFGRLFSFVGTKNTAIKMQKSTPELFEMDLNRPYVSGVYFTVDSELYIAVKNQEPLSAIHIRAVFADPRAVLKFNNDPKAETLEWEYPIPQNFVTKLYDDYMNSEFRYNKMLPPDTVNDGEEPATQTGTK